MSLKRHIFVWDDAFRMILLSLMLSFSKCDILRRLSQYKINVLENGQAAVSLLVCLETGMPNKWICIKPN